MSANHRIMPLVSILLPVYNAENYIADAVRSIQAQTFRDFELIIINDGSNDRSEEILKSLARFDDRIRVISRANKGLVATLNEGIEEARGRWIARMDADDLALPTRIERQLNFLKQTGADLCGASVVTFGWCFPTQRRYPLTHEAIKLQLLFNTAFAHPAVIGRREIFRRFRYEEEWHAIEDYELWTRVARSGYRMGNISTTLLRYRRTYSQVTARGRQRQDMARPKIAEIYRSREFRHIPAEILRYSHDRSGNLSDEELFSAVEFWNGFILENNDSEGVVRSGLFRFLAHNATRLQAPRMQECLGILTKAEQKKLGLLRILRLAPSARLWRHLYLFT